MNTLFIEAESFRKLGGWVIDPSAMEEMGSAYLMAHGIGIPVADAETEVELPAASDYLIYARTRDWTAVWKRGTPAGRFTLHVDGVELPAVLGTNGEAWAWQKAGTLRLEAGTHRIALHDLTGFNGRCDALYFSDDPADIPPDGGEALTRFRREKLGVEIQDDPGEYDLVVAGGGIAGCCTALAAARLGLRTVLLQDREILGGCNSSEIRVPLGGCVGVGSYPKLGNTVREIAPIYLMPGAQRPEWYEDIRKENAFRVCGEYSELRLCERVCAVECDPSDSKLIRAVVTRNTRSGVERRYRAPLFADCTGDGIVAGRSGAEFLYGTEGRERFGESLAPERSSCEVMGLSALWTSVEEERPAPFPEIDWGVAFSDSNCYYTTSGDWETETGQYRNQALEAEYIRDYSLMTTFANWSFVKNRSKRRGEWRCRRIDWISSCGGKRESRRFIGDYILTQNDIENGVEHPDGTAPLSWSIDLHYPEPSNLERFAEPFRSCAYHRGLPSFYPVPYRCLYSKEVKNLFLGGRLLSLSHIAFSAARVMRTLGMLGEVVAMAAAVCREKKVSPREVGGKNFPFLKEKMQEGVPVPAVFDCPSVERYESYHFKEAGQLVYREDGKVRNLSEQLKSDIRKLGKSHLFPHTGK